MEEKKMVNYDSLVMILQILSLRAFHMKKYEEKSHFEFYEGENRELYMQSIDTVYN